MNCVDVGALQEYILQGFKEARKSRNKTVVVVLGPTGSGKSTILNYLKGCRMKMFSRAQLVTHLGLSQTEAEHICSHRLIDVSPDSQVPAAVQIGHQHDTSKTLLPEMVTVPGIQGEDDLFFWDCPGLGDTRGVEVRVANAANMRRVVHESSRVKVLLVLDYFNFQSGRASALRDTLATLSTFFGSWKCMLQNRASILVLMSKIPPWTPASPEDPDEQHTSLQEFQEQLEESTREDYRGLWKNLILYDPLDRPLEIQPSLNRVQVLQRIREMTSVYKPSTVFLTTLAKEDEDLLLKCLHEVVSEVCDLLKKGALCHAGRHFILLLCLKSLDHPKVDETILAVRDTVDQILTKYKKLFWEELDENHEMLLCRIRSMFEDSALEHYSDENQWRDLLRECEEVNEFETQMSTVACVLGAIPILLMLLMGLK